MKYLLVLSLAFFTSHSQAQDLLAFPEEALNDVFLTEDASEITLEAILDKHEGKTVFIDVWATWCRDCIKGMPKVKKIQSEFKDVEFVFLSLDKEEKSWKKGIKKYQLVGDHYYVSSGWKGSFSTTINLDWIPRYMVVDPSGKITVYRAVEADDARLEVALSGL